MPLLQSNAETPAKKRQPQNHLPRLQDGIFGKGFQGLKYAYNKTTDTKYVSVVFLLCIFSVVEHRESYSGINKQDNAYPLRC